MDKQFVILTIINFIFGISLIFVFKEALTIHMGEFCSYDSTPWATLYFLHMLVFTSVALFAPSLIHIKALLTGIIVAVSSIAIYLLILYLKHTPEYKQEQLAYEEERKIKQENIDKDKLNQLLKLNKEKGLKPEERYCNCSCPFLNKTIDNCEIKKMYDEENMSELFNETPDEIVENNYGCDYAISCISTCCNLHCEVFGCTVDPITYCAWDKQKGLCLLSQCCENDVIQEILNNPDTYNKAKE